LADHVSRIDVQVTIQETPPCTNFAEESLAIARLDRRVRAGLCLTTIVSSTPAGTTAYIGTRISDRFYRIYDKNAESKGVYLPGSWRYEIEYKGHRAQRVGERLKQTKGEPESCREVVEAAFLDYGINLPCPTLPRGWRDSSPRMETTDERRLAWLEKSIAPVVSRMMESMDRRMVLEALGIIVEGQDDGIDSSTGEIPPG
jgi:DNA relaxase NicK